MDTAGAELTRGSVVGGYRIEELLSPSAVGLVYRATHIERGEVCALRVVAAELATSPEFRASFDRDTRIAASIRHPNMVGIRYAGAHQGRLLAVTEFVAGPDLRHVLLTNGPLEADRAVEMLEQVASALDAAHRHDLFHGDVKPDDVLLDVRDGRDHAYLTGFGLFSSPAVAAALSAGGLTDNGAAEVAPEIGAGRGPDTRSDVYGLGALFFAMLTGHVMAEPRSGVSRLLAEVGAGRRQSEQQLGALYPVFGPVIERALAKDAADRYESAGDLAGAATAALKRARGSARTRLAVAGGTHVRPADDVAAPPHTAPPLGAQTPEPAAQVAVPQPGTQTPEPAAQVTEPPTRAAELAGAPGAARPLRARLRVLAASRRGRSRLAMAGLLVAAGAGAAIATSLGTGPASGQPFAAAERPVPTNHVSGSGNATVSLHGDLATVTLTTVGLLDGSPHLIHIHGGGRGLCPPPSAARLHNGHVSISTGDGIKFYGPPLVSLTLWGDTSAKSNVAFGRYPAVGTIRYRRTIRIPPVVASLIRRGNAVFIVHGIDWDHKGVYDFVLGRSDLDPIFTGDSTAPALCGPLDPRQTAPVAATPKLLTTYAATLRPYRPLPDGPVGAPALYCHVAGGEGRARS